MRGKQLKQQSRTPRPALAPAIGVGGGEKLDHTGGPLLGKEESVGSHKPKHCLELPAGNRADNEKSGPIVAAVVARFFTAIVKRHRQRRCLMRRQNRLR